jgi:hypothetical protein
LSAVVPVTRSILNSLPFSAGLLELLISNSWPSRKPLSSQLPPSVRTRLSRSLLMPMLL